MKRFSKIIMAAIYTGAVFMGGMLVGQLYALYVLVFTGAVFMIGVWLGQRAERRWSEKGDALASELEAASQSVSDEPLATLRSKGV